MLRVEIVVKVSESGPYGPTGPLLEASRVTTRYTTPAGLRRVMSYLSDDAVTDVVGQLRAKERADADDDPEV